MNNNANKTNAMKKPHSYSNRNKIFKGEFSLHIYLSDCVVIFSKDLKLKIHCFILELKILFKEIKTLVNKTFS